MSSAPSIADYLAALIQGGDALDRMYGHMTDDQRYELDARLDHLSIELEKPQYAAGRSGKPVSALAGNPAELSAHNNTAPRSALL